MEAKTKKAIIASGVVLGLLAAVYFLTKDKDGKNKTGTQLWEDIKSGKL